MRSMLVMILISLEVVLGSNYFWRDYSGNKYDDALVDKDTGLAIVQVYSPRFNGLYPTGIDICSGKAEVTYWKETITDNIKVLSTENPGRFYWEWVDAATLKSTSDQCGLLVKGGQTSTQEIYIAKAFIRGYWYLGELESGLCKFYNVPKCYHPISANGFCLPPDCMVLKYRNLLDEYYIA